LIFTSGVASGINSYAAVLVLGLLGRFGHIAAIPPVLAAVVLAAGIALFALLASRIRRGWHRRRDARLRQRSSGGGMAGAPAPQP
jgi:hypothetical protein